LLRFEPERVEELTAGLLSSTLAGAITVDVGRSDDQKNEFRVRVYVFESPPWIHFIYIISTLRTHHSPMRNIVPSAIKISSLEATYDKQPESIVAAAFDIDRELIFAASEDAQGGVRIWRTPVDPCQWNAPILCGSFDTTNSKVLSLRVIGESAQLVLVTRGGDTVSWQLDESGNFIVRPYCSESMVEASYTNACRATRMSLGVLIQVYWLLDGALMTRFLLSLLVSLLVPMAT